MARLPKLPQEVFQPLADDYKTIFGDDLIAVVVFGSAARGDYIPKRSDINFLIILADSAMSRLKQAFSLVSKWKKRNVSTPLFLTRQYIETALDSYPIEFLTMKLHYRLIYGEDVLAGLEIQPEHLRLQCERELRGKLIHLREQYLNTGGKARRITQLIRLSLPTYVPIFSALLYLKQVEIPPSKQQIILTTADTFELDRTVFDELLKFQTGRVKLNQQQQIQLLDQYINQLEKLIAIVDKL